MVLAFACEECSTARPPAGAGFDRVLPFSYFFYQYLSPTALSRTPHRPAMRGEVRRAPARPGGLVAVAAACAGVRQAGVKGMYANDTSTGQQRPRPRERQSGKAACFLLPLSLCLLRAALPALRSSRVCTQLEVSEQL